MSVTLPRRASLDDVLERLGPPSPVVAAKILSRLDEHCRRFIARAPLAFLATGDAEGHLDCSPRGDQPGFATVLSDRLIAIPERRGNRIADSLRNIAEQPGVGLLFVVPGRHDTLRVNGRAYLSDEPSLLESMAVGAAVPTVAIVVEVEQAYLHCGRALLRARAWEGGHGAPGDDVPGAGRMLADAITTNLPEVPVTAEAVDEDLAEAYRELY